MAESCAVSVLVDATPLASGHRWRGIGSYVRHLVHGLVGRVPEGTRFLTLTESCNGIPQRLVVPLRARVPVRWDDFWALYTPSLRRTVADSGCSVYHFTSAEASTQGNGFKTVATVYDLIPLEMNRTFTFDPRSLWRYNLYKLYLRRLRSADHIVAISRSTAQAVIDRLAFPAERVTVIPLGIDQADYRERAERRQGVIRESYHLPEKYWFTVTSPNPNKGWPDLIRALARASESGSRIPLVVAGYWLPRQREQLIAQARSLGVVELVRFLGYVPEDDLAALYARALGFVFPSHREGFGLPVLEAMAVGTPVIASDDPALRELSEGAALGFPRGDAAVLADRLVTLAADGELRSTLSRMGAERAALFSWKRTVDQTLAVYQAVAAA